MGFEGQVPGVKISTTHVQGEDDWMMQVTIIRRLAQCLTAGDRKHKWLTCQQREDSGQFTVVRGHGSPFDCLYHLGKAGSNCVCPKGGREGELELQVEGDSITDPFPTNGKTLPLFMEFRNGTRSLGSDGVTIAGDILVGTQLPG